MPISALNARLDIAGCALITLCTHLPKIRGESSRTFIALLLWVLEEQTTEKGNRCTGSGTGVIQKFHRKLREEVGRALSIPGPLSAGHRMSYGSQIHCSTLITYSFCIGARLNCTVISKKKLAGVLVVEASGEQSLAQ